MSKKAWKVRQGIVLGERTTDPSDAQDGQIWYNSTLGKFRKREDGVTRNLAESEILDIFNSEDVALAGQGSVYVNIDSNNDSTTEVFEVSSNRTQDTGGNVLLSISEAGDAEFTGSLSINGVEVVDLSSAQSLTNKTISYDNSTSGLTATDVQAAIDEVEARVDTIETDLGDDIEGPGASTDNAVVRWDGASGRILQDSLVTISDQGDLDVSRSQTTGGPVLTVQNTGLGGSATALIHANVSSGSGDAMFRATTSGQDYTFGARGDDDFVIAFGNNLSATNVMTYENLSGSLTFGETGDTGNHIFNGQQLNITNTNTNDFAGININPNGTGAAYMWFNHDSAQDWIIGANSSGAYSIARGGSVGVTPEFSINNAGAVTIGESGGDEQHLINGFLRLNFDGDNTGFIQVTDNSGSMNISGGAGSASGRNIFLYGNNHSTSADVMQFRASSTVQGSISAAGAWTLGPSGGAGIQHDLNGSVRIRKTTGSESVTLTVENDNSGQQVGHFIASNAGDAVIHLRDEDTGNEQSYFMGIDQSDSQSFKIVPSTGFGAAEAFKITTGGNVTIGASGGTLTHTVNGELDVRRRLNVTTSSAFQTGNLNTDTSLAAPNNVDSVSTHPTAGSGAYFQHSDGTRTPRIGIWAQSQGLPDVWTGISYSASSGFSGFKLYNDWASQEDLIITAAGAWTIGASGSTQTHAVNGNALELARATASDPFNLGRSGSTGSINLTGDDAGSFPTSGGRVVVYGSSNVGNANEVHIISGGTSSLVADAGAVTIGESGGTQTHTVFGGFRVGDNTTIGRDPYATADAEGRAAFIGSQKAFDFNAGDDPDGNVLILSNDPAAIGTGSSLVFGGVYNSDVTYAASKLVTRRQQAANSSSITTKSDFAIQVATAITGGTLKDGYAIKAGSGNSDLIHEWYNDGSTVIGSTTEAGAWTLGESGGTETHTVNGSLELEPSAANIEFKAGNNAIFAAADLDIIIDSNDNTTDARLRIAKDSSSYGSGDQIARFEESGRVQIGSFDSADSGTLSILQRGSTNSDGLCFRRVSSGNSRRIYQNSSDELVFTAGVTDIGKYNGSGAWTLGESGGTETHEFRGVALRLASPSGSNSTFSLVNQGVSQAIFGSPGTAGQLITGSLVDDLVIRSNNHNILFSADQGTTLQGSLTTAGAWTLGESGGTQTHTINGGLQIDEALAGGTHLVEIRNTETGATSNSTHLHLEVEDASTGYPAIKFLQGDAAGVNYTTMGNTSAGEFFINAGANGTSNPTFRINRSTGAIEIGRNGSSEGMTINADVVNFKDQFDATRIQLDNVGTPSLDFSSTNGAVNATSSLYLNIDSNNNGTGAEFVVASNGEGTSGTELLKITEAGSSTFTGRLGVGGPASVGATALIVRGNTTSGADQTGLTISVFEGGSDATSSITGISSGPSTVDASFNTSVLSAFAANNSALGTGASATRHIMFFGSTPTRGGSNANFADNATFSGDWFINSTSTSPSLISGALTYGREDSKNFVNTEYGEHQRFAGGASDSITRSISATHSFNTAGTSEDQDILSVDVSSGGTSNAVAVHMTVVSSDFSGNGEVFDILATVHHNGTNGVFNTPVVTSRLTSGTYSDVTASWVGTGDSRTLRLVGVEDNATYAVDIRVSDRVGDKVSLILTGS